MRLQLQNNKRLKFDEIMALYEENNLLNLAEMARQEKERKSGDKVYYTINRHINLTNECELKCPLCAYCRGKSFTVELEEVEKVLVESQRIPELNEIHIVSAIHPDKNFEYYLDAVKMTKKILPRVRIAAFTPVEIDNFARKSNKSYEEILRTLKENGVTKLLGGGAEIFSTRVREIICPKKITGEEWLEIMRTAHKIGIKSNASILYGHIETVEERIEHLLKLRELQDETGGFEAMILFPFQPANTELGKKFKLRRIGAYEELKFLAITRLVLDNFENVKSLWVMMTKATAQLSLAFGADDLGGTIGEEKIIHAAGVDTARNISREELEKIILETGYRPERRQ